MGNFREAEGERERPHKARRLRGKGNAPNLLLVKIGEEIRISTNYLINNYTPQKRPDYAISQLEKTHKARISLFGAFN